MERIVVLIINFYFAILVAAEKHECLMNACDSFKEGKLFAEEFAYELMENMTSTTLKNLERRIRSLEQPGKIFSFITCLRVVRKTF